MKIILVGGGTLGSVTPLIAIAEHLKDKNSHIEFLWIGTKSGPERDFVFSRGINYKFIPTGKFRRYFSISNIIDPFKIILGFLKSIYLIFLFKPNLVISAGSFVQVPVMYAAKLFPRVKIIIHQQDVLKGLANQLCAKIADKITVALKESLTDFQRQKTVWVGNPYRPEILIGDAVRTFRHFQLQKNQPTLLIIGGGTGALSLNVLIDESLKDLVKFCQIIHLTGKDKKYPNIQISKYPTYHQYDFLGDDLKDVYAIADVVISRAGLNVLTELGILAKPIILIPLPCSHQEFNAQYFEKREAALVLNQNKTNPDQLVRAVKNLLDDKELRFKLSVNINKIFPRNANERFVEEIVKMSDVRIQVKKW